MGEPEYDKKSRCLRRLFMKEPQYDRKSWCLQHLFLKEREYDRKSGCLRRLFLKERKYDKKSGCRCGLLLRVRPNKKQESIWNCRTVISSRLSVTFQNRFFHSKTNLILFGKKYSRCISEFVVGCHFLLQNTSRHLRHDNTGTTFVHRWLVNYSSVHPAAGGLAQPPLFFSLILNHYWKFRIDYHFSSNWFT